MKMIEFLQVFSILTVQVRLSFAWNYCSPHLQLCNGSSHFICDLKELDPFGGTTEFVGHVIETDLLKEQLLDFQNTKRNFLAGGYILGHDDTSVFPTASRMRAMLWDDELAYMARLYTSRVSKTRPKCYNTKRFKSCGHLVGVLVVTDDKDLQTINQNIIHELWEEHATVSDPKAFIENYDSEKDKNAENFALLASEKVSKMGCAISMGVNCVKNHPTYGCYFLSCFYDASNKDDSVVYKAGKPGVDCIDWGFGIVSPYDYLC